MSAVETGRSHGFEQQLGLSGHNRVKEPATNLRLEISQESQEDAPMRPFYFKNIALTSLNVIVQSRDDYGDVGSLAKGIKKGRVLIHHPLAAEFDEESARKYLIFVYNLYGDKVSERRELTDLRSANRNGKEIYYIVISGHRRLEALGRNGEKKVMTKVLTDIDPLHALYLQAQENTAKPLADWERAEQHGRLWRVSKALNQKLTLVEFAGSVGVKEDAIRRDLRYFNLPDEVKEYVVTPVRQRQEVKRHYFMPFNVACQLGRLVDVKADLHDILFLARRFFEEGVTSEDTARERVSRYIRDNIKNKTSNLVDIFGVNLERLSKVKKMSQIERRYAGPVDDAIAFFRRVVDAHNNGLGDPHENTISLVATASRLESFAMVMSDLIDQLKGQVKDPQKVQKVIGEIMELREFYNTMGIKPEGSAEVAQKNVFPSSPL